MACETNLNEKQSGAPKTAAAVHDLSGFGRCSLAVVLPVLGAMGIQPVPMPTALLSTHTGGFTDFTFLDLTAQMKGFGEHWERLGIRFDAIYTGFLGSEEQCGVVERFIQTFRTPDSLVLIDPVMGDDGALYATITEGIRAHMKQLVASADVITPNVTEACFLLERPYSPRMEEADVCKLLEGLSALGAKKAVVTGIHIGMDIVTACCDFDTGGSAAFFARPRIPKSYPGTGDLFASILLGRLLRGDALENATALASDFVYQVMVETARLGLPERDGVVFEKYLYRLFPERLENNALQTD